MSTPKYVSLLRLAEESGLSPAWIRREAAAGRLPHLKVGRRTLFNPSSVAEALRDREQEALAARDGGRSQYAHSA
jgi:hypothetical protein